jgi:hypothetical protein
MKPLFPYSYMIYSEKLTSYSISSRIIVNRGLTRKGGTLAGVF